MGQSDNAGSLVTDGRFAAISVGLARSDLLKQLQSPLVDLPIFRCFSYRAVRFVRVAAIGEAALAQVGQEFGEAFFYCGKIQMMQAEQLHAGAVDEVAVGVEVIQLGVGGGVLAGIEHGGDLACGGLRFGYEGVDERGFAHAGLPDQYAGVALQIGQQWRYVLLGGQFQYAVADGSVGRKLRARRFDLRQIALVQHDDDIQILVMSGEETARQQFVVERRLGGNDDDELRDVGGDEFLFKCIGAVEQGGARRDACDDALIGTAALDLDHITARDLAFLAARHAFQNLPTGQFSQIVTPEGGDDLSLQLQILNNASTFAAQMKSLSDRPPTAWVVYSTRHLL